MIGGPLKFKKKLAFSGTLNHQIDFKKKPFLVHNFTLMLSKITYGVGGSWMGVHGMG